MQTSLVDLDVLNEEERRWVNEYNAEVQEKLAPLFEAVADERAEAWLRRQCQAV